MSEISKMEIMEEEAVNRVYTLSPINVPLILSEISGYCSIPDLKSFRQVSRLWQDSSLKTWKSSATIKLDYSYRKEEKTLKFIEFSKEYADNQYGHFPFAKFELEGVFPKEFWNLCGNHIKILKLSQTQFLFDVQFCDVIYKFCPNMEQLILENVSVMNAINPKDRVAPKQQRKLKSLTIDYVNLKISWNELFNQFPCLEILNLGGQIDQHNELFQALHDIRQTNPSILNLKQIHTPFVYSDDSISKEILELLLNTNLQLRSLSISVNSLSAADDLKFILCHHEKSLERLSVYKYQEPSLDPNEVFYKQPIWNSPPMPLQLEKLQELCLMSHQVFSSFEYLRHTPNLIRLRIRSRNSFLRDFDLPQMPGVKLPHCRDLGIVGQIMTENLKQLMDVLPNVETLQMQLNNKQFALVCERWQKLTNVHLTIGYGSEVDDLGIAGLNRKDVYKINKSERKLKSYCWSLYPAPRANILNLKHLRNFSMEACLYEGSLKLGYCAAIYGIQRLSNLKQLRIHEKLRSDNQIWDILHDQFPWKD